MLREHFYVFRYFGVDFTTAGAAFEQFPKNQDPQALTHIAYNTCLFHKNKSPP